MQKYIISTILNSFKFNGNNYLFIFIFLIKIYNILFYYLIIKKYKDENKMRWKINNVVKIRNKIWQKKNIGNLMLITKYFIKK